MSDLTRPTPFTESERAKIERIKAIKKAEREERLRRESESLWRECYSEGWVTEALEMQEARREAERTAKVREELRAAAELERVRAEVLSELAADD